VLPAESVTAEPYRRSEESRASIAHCYKIVLSVAHRRARVAVDMSGGTQSVTKSLNRSQLGSFASLTTRARVTNLALAVGAVAAVGCGSGGAARVMAPNDLFSVAIPQGWHQTAVTGPVASKSFPDAGALRLVGPSNRIVDIRWIDGPLTNGLSDQTNNVVRNLPVTVGGDQTVLADFQTTDMSGVHHRVGLLSGVSHTVHGRQVGFTATCQPASISDGDYSWCLDILGSWEWGSGTL
jgi:hypothetical protein